jgi:hypothetical protein
LNGRDHFWNGAQLAEFVDAIGCQDCLVIHVFLANADPAQLVTDYSDILFSGLHNGRYYFFYDTIKRCFYKNTVFYSFKKNQPPDWHAVTASRNRKNLELKKRALPALHDKKKIFFISTGSFVTSLPAAAGSGK